MRVTTKLAAAVVAGALSLGTAGTAVAAPAAPAPSHTVAQDVPDTKDLQAQLKVLANASVVLTPVTAALDAAIKGDLTKADATKHSTAVADAIAKLKAGKGASPETLKLQTKALADLQAHVDAALAASVEADKGEVALHAQAAVTASVNVLLTVVLGGNLPAPDLKGLPKLPELPGVDATKLPGAGVETPELPTDAATGGLL